MDYIGSFTEEEFCNLILQTKESLFLCLPLLQPKVISAINKLDDNWFGIISINIGLDFTDETFRQGYGEIISYNDILTRNYNLQQMKDNRISFIITDSVGYYLFFESRYLLPADKATLNAVLIDPLSIVRLKQHFFKTFKKADFTNELANAIIKESNQLKNIEAEFEGSEKIITSIIDSNIIEAVQESLEKNPPLKPDYKRLVEYYCSKFQYAKLEFKGANLNYRKIEIPQEALPVMDAELKKMLETKLNLFDMKDQEKYFKPLNDYNSKIAALRETYFTKIKSRDESLISKSHKSELEKKIDELDKGLENLKSEIIKGLAQQIISTKERLLKDLKDFFIENPKALFPKHPHLWQNNKEYVALEAAAYADELINNTTKIKWPKAHLLVEEFKLKIQFSDITIEDLENEEFITELKGSGLISEADINQLAEFGIAINVSL